MAKKQQIILTHGTGVPTYDKSKFAKGELLVRHASDEKDAALYTANDGESAFIAFPSKAYVDDQITKVDASGIGTRIDALDAAYKAADNAINAKFGDGIGTGANEKTVAAAIAAEAKARGDEDAAINAKFGEGIGTGTNEKTVAAAIAAEQERATGIENSLQTAVNKKVAQSDYDEKVGIIDASIAGLEELLEGYTGKGSVKTAVDLKVAQSDYDAKMGEIDGSINAIKTDIKNLGNTYATDDELNGVKTELEGEIAEAKTTLTEKANPEFGVKVVKTIDSTDKHANYEISLVDVAKDSELTALTTKVTTLIGNDANMSARGIVQDEVTKQLTDANISESFDTLKEMATWLSSHPQDVTEMQNNITDINARIGEGFGTTAGLKTIAQTIADVESSLTSKFNDYYTEDEIDAKVRVINEDVAKAKAEAKTTLTEANPDFGVKVVKTTDSTDKHANYEISLVDVAKDSDLNAIDTAYKAADNAINAIIGEGFGTTAGLKTIAQTIAAEAKARGDEDAAINAKFGEGIGTGTNEKTVAAAIAAEQERATGIENGLAGRLKTVEDAYVKTVVMKNDKGEVVHTYTPVGNVLDLTALVIDGGEY